MVFIEDDPDPRDLVPPVEEASDAVLMIHKAMGDVVLEMAERVNTLRREDKYTPEVEAQLRAEFNAKTAQLKEALAALMKQALEDGDLPRS